MTMRWPIEQRFWDKVALIPEHPCWEWTGAGSGYGRLQRGAKGSRLEMAHRVSWEIHFGPVPDGLWVLHRCDNRSCVNPRHLFLGTSRDNIADAMRKDRHPAGARHGRAIVNEDDVRAIRSLCAQMVPQRKIARMFGISQRTVLGIKRRHSWKDVI